MSEYCSIDHGYELDKLGVLPLSKKQRPLTFDNGDGTRSGFIGDTCSAFSLDELKAMSGRAGESAEEIAAALIEDLKNGREKIEDVNARLTTYKEHA